MFNWEINPVTVILVLTNLVGLIWFAFSTQSTAKSAHRRIDAHIAEYEKELTRRETAAALVTQDRERYRSDIDAKVAGLHAKLNLHHEEMLREYLPRKEFRTEMTEFESRFSTTQRDIGERLSADIKELGRRIDTLLGDRRQS